MLYPADFPFDAVKIVIEDIRTKATVTDRQKFAKALWELSGYALKSTVGEPLSGTNPPFVFDSTTDLNLDESQVADYLESSTSASASASALIALLPWRAILKWCLLRILEII